MEVIVQVPSALANRETNLCLGIDPFWSPLAMVTTQDIVLRNYFRERIVLGIHNLPLKGAVLLAPTHRARWDGLMLTMAAGRRVTDRDCRFMVTRTEMNGLQGWFLERLGCFPVDQVRPSLTSLRFAIDLMIEGQQLVVFPEGRINRTEKPIRLKQGLARLAQLAEVKGVDVQVVPVGLGYSNMTPKPFSKAAICFAEPMKVEGFGRKAAISFNTALAASMHSAEQAALMAVGRKNKAT
ncbi:lysophospholipid acyltransferase family protein [Prochlorococcus sp. MIT 1307]|uniref:lysophospholipid acyltransferase family protein n=1 Tax=Prochlorococcus sp. MIT 1307 TaxID=3096219 RepID=UPI002A75E82B|nr:lysophospholipid acyltransferase family protein [Prochlorococcus sp. MIT 1307]